MTGLSPVSFRKGRASEPRLSKPYLPGRHSDRYWSREELSTLRDRYPTAGPAGCLPFLPKRTLDKIYAKANALGLKAPNAPVERRPAVFTPEMDARIREAFPDLTRKGAFAELASELGVLRHQLSKRLVHLELTMPRLKEPAWTDAEVALMRRVPLHNPDRCADIFRDHGFARTATSIMVKAKRLELSRRTHETLSASAAASILGVDAKWITGRCIAGQVVASRRGSQRLVQQGGDAWAIEPADLRRFVLDHLGHVDIRKVDKFAFVALLLGPGALTDQGKGEPSPSDDQVALNRELGARIADLQAENARLVALVEQLSNAHAPPAKRQRTTWKDRMNGGRRRFA